MASSNEQSSKNDGPLDRTESSSSSYWFRHQRSTDQPLIRCRHIKHVAPLTETENIGFNAPVLAEPIEPINANLIPKVETNDADLDAPVLTESFDFVVPTVVPLATPIRFLYPSSQFHESCCEMLNIKYSNKAIGFWANIDISHFVHDSIPLTVAEFTPCETQSGFGAVSLYLTGSDNDANKIGAAVNEYFMDNIESVADNVDIQSSNDREVHSTITNGFRDYIKLVVVPKLLQSEQLLPDFIDCMKSINVNPQIILGCFNRAQNFRPKELKEALYINQALTDIVVQCIFKKATITQKIFEAMLKLISDGNDQDWDIVETTRSFIASYTSKIQIMLDRKMLEDFTKRYDSMNFDAHADFVSLVYALYQFYLKENKRAALLSPNYLAKWKALFNSAIFRRSTASFFDDTDWSMGNVNKLFSMDALIFLLQQLPVGAVPVAEVKSIVKKLLDENVNAVECKILQILDVMDAINTLTLFQEDCNSVLSEFDWSKKNVASLIANFIHTEMKKKQKVVRLKSVMKLVHIISTKEQHRFQVIHGRFLTGRLIGKLPKSVEMNLIAAFQSSFGKSFVNEWEFMVNSVQTSIVDNLVEVTAASVKSCTNLGPNCRIPSFLQCSIQKFNSDRLMKYRKKDEGGKFKISIECSLGKAEILAKFYNKGVEQNQLLEVTTYQMCILLIFNKCESATFKEMERETDLPPTTLKSVLSSLTQTKDPILKQVTCSPDYEASTFVINEAFNCKESTKKSLPKPKITSV